VQNEIIGATYAIRMPLFFSTTRHLPDASNGPKNIWVGMLSDAVFVSSVNPGGSAVVAVGASATSRATAATDTTGVAAPMTVSPCLRSKFMAVSVSEWRMVEQ
jgi:hypothetical protein